MIDSKVQFINQLIPEPPRNIPSTPPPSPPLPQRKNQQRQHTSTPPRHNQRQRNSPQNSPPPNTSPPRNGYYRDFDLEGIGLNLQDYLAILGYTLQDDISERHIRRRYMEMARKFHPDKNNPEESGSNQDEATVFFQLLNNAQSYLREVYLTTHQEHFFIISPYFTIFTIFQKHFRPRVFGTGS